MDIEQTAKQLCIDYYQKQYFHQPKIDRENLCVQVENFEWNGAIYRIDLFFLHQSPSFIPYHQNFWMTHRIWMTKNGKAVKQEPVYTSNAVHPELKSKGKENIIGMFPGNYFFKKEFDFIDETLRKSPVFTFKSGPHDHFTHHVEFKAGIKDLERFEAEIIQLSNGYRIICDGEKLVPKNGLSMYDLSFEISNEGKCSSIISEIRNIPGLC